MNNSISNLTKALLKAQVQMGAATKGAKNPFFKSTYADLPTVMEVVKGPLNENGIIVLQPALYRDGKNFIATTLIHAETGEMLSSETEVVCAKANDPQAFGAAQTYARRFGLQATLFIPAEDDDGNYASGRTVAKTPYVAPTKSVASAGVSAPTGLVATESLPVGAVQAAPAVVAGSKSSFRKTKATQAAAPVVTETTTAQDDWS